MSDVATVAVKKLKTLGEQNVLGVCTTSSVNTRKSLRKKCEHGRQRNICKECGGASICEHGRRRNICKECGGASICEHGRRRNRCKECGGSSICEHGRRRSRCKECGGSSICDHGRQRRLCKECGGASICEHGRRRNICKECGGSSICEHGHQRRLCKGCGGSYICEHGRQRTFCVYCGGSRACRGHVTVKCGHLGNPKYDMYCTHCFPQFFKDDPRVQLIRKKSHETTYVNMILTEIPLDLGWVWDKPIYVDIDGGCCATKRRIDLRVLVDHPKKGLFWLCVEIDERQHKSYATGYEEARYNDLFMDFSGRYVFLRINPDSFIQDGSRVNPPFEDRRQLVIERILELVQCGPSNCDQLVDVHHLFYDTSESMTRACSSSSSSSGETVVAAAEKQH